MGLTPFGQVEPLGPPVAGLVIGFSRDMADGRVLPAAKNGYIKDDISSRLSVSKSLGL